MGLPQGCCTTVIILLDQFYTLLERTIASLHKMRRHLRHMDHPSDLVHHPLQLRCSRSEVKGEGEVVGKVMVDRVVVLLVVPLMRLPCHPSIPHHPPRLPYRMSFPHHPFILSYHPRIPHHPQRLPLHMSSHHYHPHLQP